MKATASSSDDGPSEPRSVSASRKAGVLVVGLVLPVLAGCLSLGSPTGPPQGPAGPDLPPLRHYRTCRAEEAHHGWGQEVPCNGTASRAQWRANPPPGWVRRDPWVEFAYEYWSNASSVEEQWGFRYDLVSGVDRAGGVFLVETQDERRLYHWPVVPAERGFVAFPPGAWGDEVVIDVFIYDSWYRTNSTELTPGTLHQGWSLEPENRSGEGLDFYLVQNLETPDETYHFPVGPAAMGYTEGFTGPDFDLWTKVEVVGGYYGERFRPVPLPADALQAPEGSVDI